MRNQKFRSSILNSKISKQIHDQQETSLCWAFALSTMLKTSLVVFLESFSPAKIDALDFVDSKDFHKRLRSEITMMPIPKPSVIKYKMIGCQNAEDFEDDIIEKQSHNLKLAVLRVSYFFHRKEVFQIQLSMNIQLVYPSAIDPPGIKLLRSIGHVFRKSGMGENPPIFQMKAINTVQKLKQYLLKNQTCISPAISAYNFSTYEAHAMVAAGIIFKEINGKIEDFVQCKNSYRDDPSQPGLDYQHYTF